LYLLLIAAGALSGLMRYVTKGVREVFGFYVGTAYFYSGIKDLLRSWNEDSSTDGRRGDALIPWIIALLVMGLAHFFAHAFTSSRMCIASIRDLLHTNALTIAIILTTLIANILFRLLELEIDFVQTPAALTPTSPQRSWMPTLPSSAAVYAWGLVYALPIVAFFYVDQLVSAGLAQPAELDLKKGRYYHAGFFNLAWLNVLGPLFGLPWVTGALPQSPELTLAMTKEDEEADAEAAASDASDARSRPQVWETKLPALFAYVIVAVCCFVPVSSVLPVAAMSGTLVHIGLVGMGEGAFSQRIRLLFTGCSRYDEAFGEDYAGISPARVHLFTLFQMIE
jgi:hypothetical protein